MGVSTGFKGAMTAFDDLVKIININKLDDVLPLTLLIIGPISETLRHTSIVSLPSSPASLFNTKCSLPPIEVVIEFEKSPI